MYKGIYVAMTGATLRAQELDNVANNLSNVNTSGYKKTAFSSRFASVLEGLSQRSSALYPEARGMADSGKFQIDNSDGAIKTTGNPLDVAIRGEGFFAVQDKGKTFYTRNGSFSLDRSGSLITGEGYKVLNTSQKPVMIGKEHSAGSINIARDGSIYIDDQMMGKLKVVKLNELQHVGNSLYTGKEAGIGGGEVLQSSIEMSNVNPVRELIGIVNAMRQYDAAHRVIRTFDELAQRTMADIARL